MNSGGGDDRNLSGKTILRPQPGGPRHVVRTDNDAAAQGASARPPPVASGAGPIAVDEFIARSDNPIVAAAGPLLSLGANMGSAVFQADVAGLRRQAIEEVKAFEARARTSGANADDVVIARYILCTFVDSAIFQTPWGGQGAWGAQSLLALFHQEASGGEKFFQILDRLRQDPGRYLDLIELQYLCLALGFEGRYRLEPNGRSAVIGLQDEIYRLICARRPSPGSALSPRWEAAMQPKAKVLRLLPWWVVVVGAATVLIGTLILLRARLGEVAAPVVASLAVRGVELGYSTEPAAAGNRLKQLLRRQEQAGLLMVEESGARSVVTLQTPELFESGSATVSTDQRSLIRDVGHALEAVPGRVLVVGHTDDQPLRSFRYADNFELSRERAMAVVALLRPELSDASRLEWTGLGSTKPRYEPPSSAENRRRNRRVEIVHQAE